MKNKRILLFVSVAFIGIGIWNFWSQNEQVMQEPSPASKPQEKASQENKPDGKKALLGRSESDPAPSEIEVIAMINQNPKLKKVMAFGQAKNTHVYFYGKVIDQHGEPVTNAKVNYGSARWGLLHPIAGSGYVFSDEEGNFAVEDIKAYSFSLSDIEKEGYEDSRTNRRSFRGYNEYPEGYSKRSRLWTETSTENPWVFRMWKKTEAEPLVYSEKRVYMPFDGKVIPVNFSSDDSSSIFKMSITRSGTRSEPSDWSISLDASGGGFHESNEVFMNLAPEDDYQNRVLISYKKEDQDYASRANRKFFLKARGGQIYARLEMQIRPFFNDQESAVFIKYWINPNGSRNLQYNPAKRIYLK